MLKVRVLFVLALFFAVKCFAYKNHSLTIGVGYFAENVFNKTSQNDDGKTGLLGAANYPLSAKYDLQMSGDWFFAPQLSYTLFPRSTNDSAAKVTITNLIFQFGKNLGGVMSSGFDWYFGPGCLSHQTKGNGGTTTLPNGTGTSVVNLPGRTQTAQKITVNFGGAYSFGKSRMTLDLITENFFSNNKRNYNLMLGYLYEIGGGL